MRFWFAGQGSDRLRERVFPGATMIFDAFISHSSKDKTIADATCAALEAAGIRCWIAPRDVVPGHSYGEDLIDALDACRVMVLVFSSNSNASPQISREVERCVSRGITII